MNEIAPYKNYQKIVSYGRSPEVMQSFSLLLGRDAPFYVQSAILAVRANDQLLQCTPRSIFSAALRAATLRLSCDPSIGHAWLVPYKNKGIYEAQFQVGWKGLQHMALRTGKYRYINVAPVYEGEEIVEDRIPGNLMIQGTVKSPKKDKGLLASFALLYGLQKSIYMTNEELEAHGKKYSKAYGKDGSIWTYNTPAAYVKTILLKLLRTYGYIDPSDAAILDDEQLVVSDLELPDEREVTIIDQGPTTAAEASKVLGFDDDEPAPGPVEGDAAEPDGEPTRNETELISEPETVVEDKPEATKGGKKWSRPFTPESLKEALWVKARKISNPANEAQTKLFTALWMEYFGKRDDERRLVQEYLTGKKSLKEIDGRMLAAMLDWLKPEKSPDGSGMYVISKLALQELAAVVKFVTEANGQQALI